MRRFLKHKGFSVFLATFATILLSGVALAQVGVTATTHNDTAGDTASFVASQNVAHDDDTVLGDDIAETEEEDEEPPTDEVYDDVSDEPDENDAAEETVEEQTYDHEPSHKPHDEVEVAHEATDEIEIADHDDGEEPDVDDSVVLEITTPKNGAHVEREVVTFKGISDPDAVVTYGRYEARMDDTGHWAIALVLGAGKNIMSFRAEDETGNVAEASVTVYLETVEKPKPDPTFSAHQKWDVSDDDPSVNFYWGTARPGAEIFGVFVESSDGGSVDFTFVAT